MKRNLLIALLTLSLAPCVLAEPPVAVTPVGIVKHRVKNVSNNNLMSQFAQNYVLYFFYDTDCPYCREFAPILKDFVTQYKIKVIPITNDGNALPEFPNTKANQDEAAMFNVEGAPMLYALNKKTHKHYLIADGKISASELKQNVLDVAKNK